MNYSESFQTILNRINNNELQKPIFDLISVDGNAYSLMGNWQKAARKAAWSKEEIDIVLEECKQGDYDHLVATLLEVSASEPDEDEDDNDYYEDEDDRPYSQH